MTTEAFNPPTPITIATAGPHAIPFPYASGAVRASVENPTSGVITDLVLGTDYSVTPAATEAAGDLTLSGAALTAHLGKRLHITRETPDQQGWAAVQGAREKGMERQLDRLTRRIQEVGRMARAAVRSAVPPLKPFTPLAGRMVIFDSQGQPTSGPTPNEVAALAVSNLVAGVTLIGSGGWFIITGTPNALVVNTGNNLTAPVPGQKFRAKAISAASGESTLEVDELAPAAILTLAGTAVPANHWNAAQELEFTYDGAAWLVEPEGLYGRSCAAIEDRKTAGTDGGSFNQGADRTRDLNTIVRNEGGFVSLAGNRITLPKGKWRVAWSAPAFEVNAHQSWLFNVTGSVEIDRGSYEICLAGEGEMSTSVGFAIFDLAVATELEIRHRAAVSREADGFGKASIVIVPPYQVYTRVEIMALKP
jgi:hypothetical protein